MLSRTALRLSTLAVLTNGGNDPLPTMAGTFVFDSREMALSDLNEEERRPLIVVRTGDDVRAISNGRINKRGLSMFLDLKVVNVQTINGDQVINSLETDAELEASLDLLEYQIHVAMSADSLWALFWRELWWPSSLESSPVWTSPQEGRIPIAERLMTYHFPSLRLDCRPKGVLEDDLPKDTAGNPIPPSKVIPDPLKSVLDLIISKGSGDIKTMAQQIALTINSGYIPTANIYPMLKIVRATTRIMASDDPDQVVEADLLGQVSPFIPPTQP